VLLAVSPSSTADDRVALYLIPLQLFVLSRLPDVMMRDQALASVFLVVLCSALIQFVWLNFAVHAEYWVPYRFYPLELLFS
jgi:apolipoprotein N-acyltransferase